jgi:hypothetical protein
VVLVVEIVVVEVMQDPARLHENRKTGGREMEDESQTENLPPFSFVCSPLHSSSPGELKSTRAEEGVGAKLRS